MPVKEDTGGDVIEGQYMTCAGECEVCSDSTCAGSTWESANLTDSTGAVVEKLACVAPGESEAAECLSLLVTNTEDAYSPSKVNGCRLLPAYPQPTDTLCQQAAGDSLSAEEGTATESGESGDDPALGAVTLKLDPTQSSIDVHWRGGAATKAVSGTVQVTTEPWQIVFLRLGVPTTTIGGETFENPSLVLHGSRRLYGDPNGAFMFDLRRYPFIGGYRRSGDLVATGISLPGAVTGQINLPAKTWTAGYVVNDGTDSVSLSLAGTVTNRPPIPSFSTGAVANCSLPVNGSGSFDPDGGQVVRHYWYVNRRARGLGSDVSLPVSNGTNVVQLRVVDDEHSVSVKVSSVVVNVTANPPCP